MNKILKFAKWLKLGGILVLLLVVAAVVLVKVTTGPLVIPVREEAQESTISARPNVTVVSFKDGVFTPDKVQVKIGTLVMLRNDGKDQLEVELGKHGEEQSLSWFEAKLLSGSRSYTFAPKEKGSFIFHNHLDPKKYGELTIE